MSAHDSSNRPAAPSGTHHSPRFRLTFLLFICFFALFIVAYSVESMPLMIVMFVLMLAALGYLGYLHSQASRIKNEIAEGPKEENQN